MQEDTSPEEKNNPDAGFGKSGGYFGEGDRPKDMPESNIPPSSTGSSQERPPDSSVPPKEQPSVDNFSAPGQTSPPSTKEAAGPGELRMPTEGEMGKTEEKVEVTRERPETGGPAEDIFEKKEEPESPEPEREKPEEPKMELKEKGPEAGQKLGGIEPEKKRGGCKGCIIAIIVFVVIVLGLGALIYVNETGILDLGLEKYYGKIGLEKIWGGLGEDGKAAMAKSVSKISEKKSFAFSGENQFSLEIKSETASLEEEPKESGVLGVEDSISTKIKQGFDIDNKININGKVQEKDKYEIVFAAGGTIDILSPFVGADASYDLTISRNGESIFIKSDILKNILKSEKDWLKIETGEEDSLTSVVSLSGIIKSGQRSGWEKVDGVSCYRYDLSINSQELGQYLEGKLPLSSSLISEISVIQAKAYLGKKDHLIRKFEIEASESSENVILSNKINLSFSGFGEAQRIELPDEEEAKQEQWQTIESVILGTQVPAEETAEERDNQRKKDLNEIKAALEAYQEIEKEFPSTNGEVVKTRDENTILSNALVPKYLESLPVDPQNDKYYYGYSSDGKSYKLTCILENKSDPEGTALGDLWLYVIEI